jgi:hypothetical protein
MGQEKDQWTFGELFGELWTIHADNGADVGSFVRFMPKATSPMLGPDTYIHSSMEVDTVSSFRRYPQVLISDQPWPVQDNFLNGSTVVVEPFGANGEVEIEFCDHTEWTVNPQCPYWDINTLHDSGTDFLAPHVEMTGLQGVDRTVAIDVYVSTQRVYAFVNQTPYGCVDLPPGRLSAGPGTVTFGDVLYHSGADLKLGGRDWYSFHDNHMEFFQARHFSNLGVSSNVPQPEWNYDTMPCVPAAGLVKHP